MFFLTTLFSFKVRRSTTMLLSWPIIIATLSVYSTCWTFQHSLALWTANYQSSHNKAHTQLYTCKVPLHTSLRKLLTWMVGSNDSATATFNLVGRTRLKLASLLGSVLAIRFWQRAWRDGMPREIVAEWSSVFVATNSFWSLWPQVMAVTDSYIGWALWCIVYIIYIIIIIYIYAL